MEKELTTHEAAVIAGISASLIRRWCRQGKISDARLEGTGNRAVWYVPESWAREFERTKHQK